MTVAGGLGTTLVGGIGTSPARPDGTLMQFALLNQALG